MPDEQTDRFPTSRILLGEAERRVAVRYSCILNSLCQTKAAQPEDFWWWGNIRDISRTGVGLLIPRGFEPGTQLVLGALTSRDASDPLLVRVMRAERQSRGGWLLGCEFASPRDDQIEDVAALLPALR